MQAILLLGPPGAGKGSVANWLVQNQGFYHLSTGQIFRSLSHQTDPLAQEVKAIISSGALVPDDLTNQLILATIKKLQVADGNLKVVFDGYPRTSNQAEFLNQHLQFKTVLVLDCNSEEVLFRLSNRWLCQAADHPYHQINNPPQVIGVCDLDQSILYQRKDDQVDVILKRLEIYQAQTAGLIDYYAAQGLVTHIDASHQLSETIIAITQILNTKIA